MNIFSPLNSYYDHIYVLTIEAAESRRKKFIERFSGLEYEFFYGADKNNFDVEQLERENIYSETLTRHNHRYSKSMRPGEIACSWSHRMMYEDMLEKGYEKVLIMEDDASPDPEQLKIVPEIIKEIPSSAELVFWGWAKNEKEPFYAPLKKGLYYAQHALGVLKWDYRIIRNMYARNFSKHLKKAGFHDFTYAYSINQRTAEKLIPMQTPIQYIADNLLAHAATRQIVEAYITYPAVFLHDMQPDASGIHSYIR